MYRYLALLMIVSSAACAGHRMYTIAPTHLESFHHEHRKNSRLSVSACDEAAPNADRITKDDAWAAIRAQACTVAVLEFDDQGEMWDKQQLEDARKIIKARSRPDQEAIVIIFVHGWKHDASVKDEEEGNLYNFKRVLAQLSRIESGDDASGRPVVGIYMAWRGKSLLWPKNLSFYSRKRAAFRVGRISMSNAIHRLVNTAKGTNFRPTVDSLLQAMDEGRGSGKPGDQGAKRHCYYFDWQDSGNLCSKVVVVGHSFGGLIVENTLLRSLTQETENFAESFPADLTMLINPAQEAILAKQFVEALKEAPPAVREHTSVPLVVSMTSKGDLATKVAFRLAQGPNSLLKRFREYHDPIGDEDNQRYYFTRTSGNTKLKGGLISHTISCPLDGGECPELTRRDMKRLSMKGSLISSDVRVHKSPEFCTTRSEGRKGVDCIQSIFVQSASSKIYQIDRLDETFNTTPFWIMRVPKRVVPDHSSIFNPEFISIFNALISLDVAKEAGDINDAARQFESPVPVIAD